MRGIGAQLTKELNPTLRSLSFILHCLGEFLFYWLAAADCWKIFYPHVLHCVCASRVCGVGHNFRYSDLNFTHDFIFRLYLEEERHKHWIRNRILLNSVIRGLLFKWTPNSAIISHLSLFDCKLTAGDYFYGNKSHKIVADAFSRKPFSMRHSRDEIISQIRKLCVIFRNVNDRCSENSTFRPNTVTDTVDSW